MTDGFVNVRDLRLHYQEWGSRNAASTVVLVHGLGSSSHIWDLTGPLLADESLLRIVAPDQRGHGESDQPASGYDFPSIVDDLAGFVDAVGIGERSVLVGHSWGASVVLHFGVSHPGTQLVWPSPWGAGFPGWHIECTAMSTQHLGPQIDIHTGGVDNIFPHHEDERAQSESFTGLSPFARVWVHGQHLLADGPMASTSTTSRSRCGSR